MKKYLFQEDEEKFNIYKKAGDKVKEILNDDKYNIKNYKKNFSLEELDDLINGNITNFIVSTKRSKENVPVVLYLTKKQHDKYLLSYYTQAKFNLNLSKKQISETLNKTKEINKKILFLIMDIKDEEEDLNIEREREYKKFIADLMKYSSKTPMLESTKQKVGKVIRSLLNERKKVGRYVQALVNLNARQIHDILKRCTQGNTEGVFTITINSKSRLKKFPFVLFLTLKQKLRVEGWKKFKSELDLDISNTQFHKTCFATIALNRDIYYYTRYEVLPPPPIIKKIDTPLAIERKNLIDFDENTIPTTSKTNPDLIPTTKPDLIPTTKPDLIPTTKPDRVSKIDELMKKILLDFTKDPYKDYTQKQSFKKIKTEVLNAFLNEINYPLTKDILGLSLTKHLKEKISKLTLEAAVGLTWIIRSLVLSNKGKLPIYYENNNYYQLSRNQIKEIIEYYFTTLAILLNPAQKC